MSPNNVAQEGGGGKKEVTMSGLPCWYPGAKVDPSGTTSSALCTFSHNHSNLSSKKVKLHGLVQAHNLHCFTRPHSALLVTCGIVQNSTVSY